jgi:hypothetical protein
VVLNTGLKMPHGPYLITAMWRSFREGKKVCSCNRLNSSPPEQLHKSYTTELAKYKICYTESDVLARTAELRDHHRSTVDKSEPRPDLKGCLHETRILCQTTWIWLDDKNCTASIFVIWQGCAVRQIVLSNRLCRPTKNLCFV